MSKRERPTRELENIIKDLSMQPWFNTPEEIQELKNAKEELTKQTKGKSNA